jgi:uncharacterized protein
MFRTAATAVFCIVALLAAGCASDPTRFYTLTAVAVPGSSTAKLSVLVGPISMPATVDRPQIVVTTGTNRVTLDDFNRWASPLPENLATVVAENLAAILGTQRVALYLNTPSGEADYRVRVDVRTFESLPGKSATLEALWTVRRSKDGKTETGRTSAREESLQDASYDALAAAHSRAAARLSQDIAGAIRALEQLPP